MARLMNTDRTPGGGTRRRALLILAGAALLVLALLVGVVVSLTSMFSADEPSSTYQGPPAATGPGADGGGAGGGNGPEAEAALARAPMLEVPGQAALPHTLSTRSAGPPITLPQPEQVSGVLVPTGFPDTEQGAIAQAVELTRVGFTGADPQVWAQAYDSMAEPGAAPAAQTPASQDLVAFRRAANMPRTGPTRATVTWTPTSALVKGSTDDGSYVVTCVLGELVTDYKGRVATGGLGNCLPMRRVGDQWLVASGPRAWVAPATWPGSDEAVSVGYRDIIR